MNKKIFIYAGGFVLFTIPMIVMAVEIRKRNKMIKKLVAESNFVERLETIHGELKGWMKENEEKEKQKEKEENADKKS